MKKNSKQFVTVWNAVLKFQIERFFSQTLYTWYLFVAESASKFGYHRYYRKKDESHGYFFHFYRIFEEHDVKNDEYKTCRWNILWKRHRLCVNSAGNMGRWSKIVHAGSSNAGKMSSYVISYKKKLPHTKLIYLLSYRKYFVQIRVHVHVTVTKTYRFELLKRSSTETHDTIWGCFSKWQKIWM